MSTRIIKINRGDSFELITSIPGSTDQAENDKYILAKDDVFYFAICYPNQPFEEAVLLKGCTRDSIDEVTRKLDQDKEGNITIKLTPKDTRPLSPGVYYYTAKLYRGCQPGLLGDPENEPMEVRTIIERTKFIINE